MSTLPQFQPVVEFSGPLPATDEYRPPGDTFVSPSGFTGCWEVTEPARKYFVVYE
jgi:hypothetical protein